MLPAEDSHTPPVAELPFSFIVRAGNFLFLSGQIGADHTGHLVTDGGVKGEARRALTNVKNLLESNAASLSHMVKCTVFMVDMSEWAAFNAVYVEFFKQPYPVRSAVGCSSLIQGARVEIECTAYVP
jgi:reactive intermediate/imine deaminase